MITHIADFRHHRVADRLIDVDIPLLNIGVPPVHVERYHRRLAARLDKIHDRCQVVYGECGDVFLAHLQGHVTCANPWSVDGKTDPGARIIALIEDAIGTPHHGSFGGPVGETDTG